MAEKIRLDDNQLIKSVESHLNNEFKSYENFNEAFDGPDPILIPSLDKYQDPHQFQASELLFYTDREAYFNELQFWESARVSEEHNEALDVLKSQDQLPLFKELAEAVTRRRIAPFIGAGLSYMCDYPTWGNALLEIKARIDGVDDVSFSDAMSRFDYLSAAQLLWDKDETQLKNYIRTKFSDGRLPDGKVKGPVTWLPRFCFGCVITTNFDPVIETVFEKRFEGYMHGVQAANKFVPKLIKGERCILKLHGDAEDLDSYVFTKNQYLNAYGEPFDFKKPLPKALRQIFVSHSMLFIGCSLETDKTLELFTHVIERSDFEIPTHFAFLPLPGSACKETKAQKENRLLKLHIHPIWFPEKEFRLVDGYLRLLIDISSGRIRV
jgi:hypothetical protein